MVENRNSSRRLMNQINVVPYIDVMLVLLVIFMITAPLINPGQIELPQIGNTSNPPVAPLEVSIRTDQSLWLRDRARDAPERRVTRDELVRLIQQYQARNPQQAVVIAADKEVRYAAVLEVMDMLQQHQVRKVGLLAKPRAP